MRNLLIALFLLPTLALAQQYHTFNNGEVADAEKINQTHQYILNNASGGGCSATQQDNSVLIQCADGTSGVIAGAGTVVLYPEGQIGDAPPITLPSGEFALLDANDVLLARSRDAEGPAYTGHLEVDRNGNWVRDITLVNDAVSQSVLLYAGEQSWVFFTSNDCSGDPLVQWGDELLYLEGFGWAAPAQADYVANEVLVKSGIYTGGWRRSQDSPQYEWQCDSTQMVVQGITPLVTFTLPDEILNAAYPVRFEQLP